MSELANSESEVSSERMNLQPRKRNIWKFIIATLVVILLTFGGYFLGVNYSGTERGKEASLLAQALEAGKTALTQIFNETRKEPVAIIDVTEQPELRDNLIPEGSLLKPAVSVDKEVVMPGEVIVESGRGFSSNSDVLMNFELPNGRLATTTIRADTSGDYKKTHLMPKGAPLGQYFYYAKDLKTSTLSNRVSFLVRIGSATFEEKPSGIVEKQGGKPTKEAEEAVAQSVKQCSFTTAQSPSHQEVIINEVAWMGGPSAAGLGATDEWIELKNLTSKPINLSGWQLINQDEGLKFVFKAGATIPPGDFFLLERSDDNSVPSVKADALYTGALSNTDEGLRLFAPDCSLIDEVMAKPSWPGGDNHSKRILQRNPDLNWSTYGGQATDGILGTPKKENGSAWIPAQSSPPPASGGSSAGGGSGSDSQAGSSGGSTPESPTDSAPTPVKIIINEVQITGGPGRTTDDFIELFNPTTSEVNLKGYRLVKRTKIGTSDTSIKSWTTDTSIPAQGYYLWANSDYSGIGVTPDVTTSAIISNDNGIAIRFGPEDTGTVIDSVGWGEAANAFVEGSVFSTNPEANQSIERKGFADTNNNANDFQLQPCPSPRAQSATCPSGGSSS